MCILSKIRRNEKFEIKSIYSGSLEKLNFNFENKESLID